jgi:hypothetical protein
VTAEGTNRDRVYEDISATQNQLMELLQPLARKRANPSQSLRQNQSPMDDNEMPAIVRLGVNDFEANSLRRKQTFLGEKPLYAANADYEAEFADFDALGEIVYKVTRVASTKITSIAWKLSDGMREHAKSKCQFTAARLLMNKARDLAGRLGLHDIRTVSIHERSPRQLQEFQGASIKSEDMIMHDELGDELMNEPALQFEPRTLGLHVDLEGEFEAF